MYSAQLLDMSNSHFACKLHHSLHLCYLPKKPKLPFIICLVFPSVLSFPVSQFHLLRRQKDLDSFWGALAVFMLHFEIPAPWSADTLVSPVSSLAPKILHLCIPHVSGSSPPLLYLRPFSTHIPLGLQSNVCHQSRSNTYK